MRKKIVIIDDHPIVRQGLAQLINQAKDLQIIGEAESTAEAVSLINETLPSLALVDITLRDSNGIELIKDLKKLHPRMPVLVVSLHDESIYAERALRAGAKGYIMKAEAIDNIMTAIRVVLSGGIYLSNKFRAQILEKLTNQQTNKSLLDILSDRELEVFQLMGEGLNTREIAETLFLSIKTIETYKSHLKRKLNLKNSTELIQHAVEWNLKGEFPGRYE